jgi:hypothetical protein
MQGRREAAAEEIRSPMAGLDLSINSAQSLAASMDNMSLGECLFIYCVNYWLYTCWTCLTILSQFSVS